jgi:VWFA-related protein
VSLNVRRAAAIACALTAVRLAAQTPAQQTPVFRAAARLVQVNVVVHDKHGQPITDLKKEDFTVLERGKPQQVALFSINGDGAPVPAAPLPPHIFSNTVAMHGGVATGVTVILLDLVNTGFLDQQRARESVRAFLMQIQPQDRIAIYTLGQKGLTLVHDYTSDAASLVARLHDVRGELSRTLDASTLNDDDQQDLRDMGLDDLAEAEQRAADFFTTNRVVNTLTAFEAIAHHLSGMPGRKSLVWVSGGIPLQIGFDEMPESGGSFSNRDRRVFTPEMDAAARALNESGIAVYPVDARGLMPPVAFSSTARRAPPKMPTLGQANANIDTMNELAERTGGRAAFNTNDLARAIRRAVDDGRVTYTLGYYSTDERQDGKFRDIKVTVDRSGADVRARKGYFALRPADTSAAARDREIRAAVWSPLEATELPFDARVDLLAEPPDTLNVFIQVKAGVIAFSKDGDRWKDTLHAVFVERDAHDNVLGNSELETLPLSLTEDRFRQVSQQGLVFQHRVHREPSAAVLRIIVRDEASGAIGSITVPFSQIAGSKDPAIHHPSQAGFLDPATTNRRFSRAARGGA